MWFVIGVIFATERVVTIWDQDFQAKFFALMMLPELMYTNVQKNGMLWIGFSWNGLYHGLAIVSIFFAILAVGTILRSMWARTHFDPTWE